MTSSTSNGFCDHLQSLVEEYQQEIIRMRRQLREESERGIKLAEEAKRYRLEYKNYKLSHVMDQATIKELKRRIRSLECKKLRRTKVSSSEVEKQCPISEPDERRVSCLESEYLRRTKLSPEIEKQSPISEPDVQSHCDGIQNSSSGKDQSEKTEKQALPRVLPQLPNSDHTKSHNWKLRSRSIMNRPFRTVTKPLCMCRLNYKGDKEDDAK